MFPPKVLAMIILEQINAKFMSLREAKNISLNTQSLSVITSAA